jgi:hypothetical protein
LQATTQNSRSSDLFNILTIDDSASIDENKAIMLDNHLVKPPVNC